MFNTITSTANTFYQAAWSNIQSGAQTSLQMINSATATVMTQPAVAQVSEFAATPLGTALIGAAAIAALIAIAFFAYRSTHQADTGQSAPEETLQEQPSTEWADVARTNTPGRPTPISTPSWQSTPQKESECTQPGSNSNIRVVSSFNY